MNSDELNVIKIMEGINLETLRMMLTNAPHSIA